MFNFTKSQTENDLARKEAKLNLKITDFKKQKHIKVGTLLAHIDRIPAFHLENLKEITYDPKQITIQDPEQPQKKAPAGIKGVYIQNKRMVSIFDTRNEDVFKHALFHEIGHHVYFVVLGQALKHIWVTEVCRYDSFITDYASLNAAEDFAESYASYLLTQNELKTIPLKFSFMEQYVFKTKNDSSKPEQLNILA